MLDKTTEQVLLGKKAPNPTGKGGFQDHPECRNPGGWKKEDSISYQYNKFMRMTAEEVREWETNYPENERTMAQELAYRAILRARKNLMDLKEITDRTEGKPLQKIEVDNPEERIKEMKQYIDEQISVVDRNIPSK